LIIGVAVFLIIGIKHPDSHKGLLLPWDQSMVGLFDHRHHLVVASLFIHTRSPRYHRGCGDVVSLGYTRALEQRERVRKGWHPANPKFVDAEAKIDDKP
jgi:hypothetical protein